MIDYWVKSKTRTQPEINTFPCFSAFRLCKAIALRHPHHQKSSENYLLSGLKFLTFQGTKRSQPCRIDEYFKEESAKIF